MVRTTKVLVFLSAVVVASVASTNAFAQRRDAEPADFSPYQASDVGKITISPSAIENTDGAAVRYAIAPLGSVSVGSSGTTMPWNFYVTANGTSQLSCTIYARNVVTGTYYTGSNTWTPPSGTSSSGQVWVTIPATSTTYLYGLSMLCAFPVNEGVAVYYVQQAATL